MKSGFSGSAGALAAGALGMAACLVGTSPEALAAEPGDPPEAGEFGFSVGAEYSSGEYGGNRSVEDLYVPVTGWYRGAGYALRVTVPYLRVEAPEGTVIDGPGGQPVPGDGPTVTESGLGDVIVGASAYDVWTTMDGSLALDVHGKVKLGTADEDKGLGTGETDFTLQADLLRFMPGATALASAGYVVRGNPRAFDLDDGLIASLGALFDLSAGARLGAFLEYQAAAYRLNDDRLELVGALSWRAADWRTQCSVSAGLSDSAPDWSVGVSVFPR